MRSSIAVAALLVFGCNPSTPRTSAPPPPSVSPDAGPPPPAFTYHRDAKPILDAKCVACHSEGGIGPVDLTKLSEVQKWAPVIESLVTSGEMPPWHADAECNTYTNNRSLSDEHKTALLEWLKIGAPEGDPSDVGDAIPRNTTGLSRVDHALPVDGDHYPTAGDDYRCFAISWPDQATKFVTGYNVLPSNPSVVHHVNVYLIEPQYAQASLDRQQRAPEPGYECFGGQFSQGTSLLGSWAPGSNGVELPANSGIQIEPGSVMVMEMHFNTASSAEPDRSTLQLMVEDQVAKRGAMAAFWNFQNWNGRGGMHIPAGVDDTMHFYQFDPGPFVPQFAPWITAEKLMIHAVGLHMHYLGTSATLKVKKYDGRQACLATIPKWDFDWQTAYFLETPIEFDLGWDRVYLECHWDNTEGNQPLVNGSRRPAQDVRWGSGSADEMCIGFFYVTEAD